MSAATHRAMFVLDVYAVDDDAAREIVDRAATSAKVDPGILALEASPPVRRRPLEDDAAPDVRLAVEDAAAVGYAVQAFLQMFDTVNASGIHGTMPAIVNRNKLTELALRLTGGDVLEAYQPLEPEPGEVYPLHRGSRA